MYEQIFELSGRMPHRLDKTCDDQLVGKTRVRERSAELYEPSDRAASVRDEQYRSVGRCLSRVRLAPRGREARRQAGNDELKQVLGIDQIPERAFAELLDLKLSRRLIAETIGSLPGQKDLPAVGRRTNARRSVYVKAYEPIPNGNRGTGVEPDADFQLHIVGPRVARKGMLCCGGGPGGGG